MKVLFFPFLISVAVVVGLGFLAFSLRPDANRSPSDSTTVGIYCASAVVKPVEQAIADYRKKYDVNVEIVRSGGSGEITGQLRAEHQTGLTGGADLIISADADLMFDAHVDGVIAEQFEIAIQRPVIAVASGSQWTGGNLRDLVDSKLRFGVASQQSAVGKIARLIAEKEGCLSQLETKKTLDAENVMTLAQALVAGSLDAAVIWDTTVAQVNRNRDGDTPKLISWDYPDPDDIYRSQIVIGVVANSDVATQALRFARFLTAPETGKSAFDECGFDFIEGDAWDEVPEIHLYCGSMLTPVLETAIQEFANREGVKIYPRWQGCEKLVASMKSIKDPARLPDAFLACDTAFLEDVQERFRPPEIISTNQIVMAARKDLKHEIRSPHDLLDLDLRIGICDPVQSALGKLTQQMLSSPPYQGFYTKLEQKPSVTVEAEPMLMIQRLADGLDVAFVYRSNVMASPQSLETLRIIEVPKGANAAWATQIWAVSKTTVNPDLMDRLFDFISRPEILERFKEYGFQIAK